MTRRERPHLPTDARRAREFRDELLARARAWVREWSVQEAPGDFGAALFDVAARFSAQVAERLDRADEKLALGLLDWLAVRSQAARPARMPVVLKLADTARDPVLAPRAVQLQANAAGGSVVFETESDVKLVPGTLAMLVAVDAHVDVDGFYLPPPGIGSLDPIEPRPDRWALKSFADAGTTRLQLDPAAGIDTGTLLESDGHQYRVVKAEGDLVTVEPGIASAAGLAQGTSVTRVGAFDPYGGKAQNWQEHGLYLGDKDVLNIEAAATIEVVGAAALREATWQFFGKTPGDAEAAWHDMPLAKLHPPGSVSLDKPPGSIEPTAIAGGEPNRWIRARLATVKGPAPLLDVEELRLTINRDKATDCSADSVKMDPGARAEGFANTTPLAFTSVFYPLGREPKQFDAFYLGCADAFSKKQAEVTICFALADASTNSFAVLRAGVYRDTMAASIGRDGALHLYRVNGVDGRMTASRPPLQPPKPALYAAPPAEAGPIPLAQAPFWRPAIWSAASWPWPAVVHVACAAGGTVWVWLENFTAQSGWYSLGVVDSRTTDKVVDGLVYLFDDVNESHADDRLFALLDGALYVHSANLYRATEEWKLVELKDDKGNKVAGRLRSIVPVFVHPVDSADWTGTRTRGLFGILEVGVVNGAVVRPYAISESGVATLIDDVAGSEPVADSLPAAARIGTSDYYFWHRIDEAGKGPVLRGVLCTHEVDVEDSTILKITTAHAVQGAELLGHSLDIVDTDGQATVLGAARKDAQSWIIEWKPFDESDPVDARLDLPAGVGPLGGAPAVIGGHVLVPGDQSNAWVGDWNPSARITDKVSLELGIVSSAAALASGASWVLVDHGAHSQAAAVDPNFRTANGQTLYKITPQPERTGFGSGLDDPNLFAFRATTAFDAKITDSPCQITLHDDDDVTREGDWIAVKDGSDHKFCKVGTIDSDRKAYLSPDPKLAKDTYQYVHGEKLAGRIAPFFRFNPPAPRSLTAAQLVHPGITFTGPSRPDPSHQRGQAFEFDGSGVPTVVALAQNWSVDPPKKPSHDIAIVTSITQWTRQLGQSSSDPELMWEYWNGSHWDKLDITLDETQDLTNSGRLKFDVPRLLAPTDVSGKPNFWIRARLVSGDYGREKVSVTTTTNGNKSTQTVDRDPSDFHPPQVVTMRIHYVLDDAVHPAEVRTQDSGSWRNQSDANRAQGARVEAFVPLSLLMARLSGQGVGASADQVAGCDCKTTATAIDDTNTEAKAADAGAGRALLLGFDTPPLGEPVNVLLLVDERALDGFAPLTAEALVSDRFEPLTARDGTRALGESGIVSMVLPVKPSPRDLFGRTLSWLRLRPAQRNPDATWQPVIQGAYLNAVWAGATETLTREPLGSSDGRPHLTLRVARPPLLQGTLELRVREPLDDEERQALLDADPRADANWARVKHGLADLPGDWVLWEQVPDPADCGPHERVYALDEAVGEIRFGDGIHGMIPPIGRDAVVAFAYQRTEPAADGSDSVTANAIEARTKLNLVTPVESVESAVAADHAAGGAPPEDIARVQRFGQARLRHRGRAITIADFEDLALASSPDIVQARAFAQAGGVRMVAVMRGAKPRPDAAQRRALLRELQAVASPLVAQHGRLVVQGARLRRLRLKLTLTVPKVDDTGAVANAVKQALAAFFDPASGGIDGTGWPLGAAPGEDDIAFALDGTPALEGIEHVERMLVGDDGQVRPWPAVVAADDLVLLDGDPVRLDFITLEVSA